MKRMWMAALAISAAMTVGCNKDHNGASGTVGTAGRNDSGVSRQRPELRARRVTDERRRNRLVEAGSRARQQP